MYYARGGDSLNFSAEGPGNAVLIKSAYPWVDAVSDENALARMLLNNPDASGNVRTPERLCAGQTLLCKALGLKVPMWDARRFDEEQLFVEDVGQRPPRIIQTTRLGIPAGRDEHLMYRFVDAAYARFCTRNPIRRGQVEGRDYILIEQGN
jgi:DNA-3-methyladenine glycosylase